MSLVLPFSRRHAAFAKSNPHDPPAAAGPLVLPGLAQQKNSSRCDPVLIKAIVRGRAWFWELAGTIATRYAGGGGEKNE